jgi:hypothetical protein
MIDLGLRLGARRSGWTVLPLTLFVFFVGTAPASAFDIPTFSVTPSTTQAAGHPNVTVQIDRTGADNEDIRDLYLDLPPGLIGNTTAVGSCPEANFNADTCPANSAVGTVSAIASATGLTLPPTTGTIYNLVPGPTEPGAIGIVLRPTGAGVVLAPVFIRGSIQVVPNGDSDVNLRNIVLNQPRQVFLLPLLGLPIPVDITVNSLTLTLNGAGTLTPGNYFLTNPTSCQPAVSRARVVSYLDQEVTKESSYTPTNCEAVPFDPFFMVDFDPTTANAATGPITVAGVPAGQDPLSQSHVKTTSIRFLFTQVLLDFVAGGRVPACSDADLAADSCPAGTDIGDLTATVPVLVPPDFTGDLYRTNHPEIGFFTVAAVIRGPRGVKTIVNGRSEFGGGYTDFVFPSQPQVPLTALKVALTKKIYKNLPNCGPKTITAHFIGHSGAERDVSDTYNVTDCAHARPRAASPTSFSLVPAYKECTSANASHGDPLSAASCNPPVQSSDNLTVGSPDANGRAANFAGKLMLKAVGESPIFLGNGDQADVELTGSLTDVRNKGDLSDYTGELRAVIGLRITDRNNSPLFDNPATVADTAFAFNLSCAATAGPEGGACNVATTADAVTGDFVKEAKRSVWQLGQVQIYDGGADGDADTPGDNTLFAVQGAYAP